MRTAQKMGSGLVFCSSDSFSWDFKHIFLELKVLIDIMRIHKAGANKSANRRIEEFVMFIT